MNLTINMPLNRLWDTITMTSNESEAKINYHLNVLVHAFDRNDIEITELCQFLHVLGLRKLYNSRSSKINTETLRVELSDFRKKYLKRSDLSEPLHKLNSISELSPNVSSHQSIHEISPSVNSEASKDELSLISSSLLFECPDISGLISAAELASCNASKHLIDNYEYFEDLDLRSSLQVLHKAFTEYNCVNYKYCRVTDSILTLFYNSQNEDGVFTEEWRTDIRTPLCMQDFFDYILDDHYDWFESQEKEYDEINQHKYNKAYVDDLKSISIRSCIQKSDLEMEMIIEGSLKHEELLKIETITTPPVLPVPQSNPGKNKANPPISSTDISKSSKKTLQTTSRYDVDTIKSGSGDSMTSFDEANKKVFLGYDLGERRVEIFGRDAAFYSKDGTTVISKYCMFFPENQEYATLNVICGNKNNEIYVHKALGIYTTPIATAIRVITKNDVQIYLSKQSYEANPQPFNFELHKESVNKSSPRIENDKADSDGAPHMDYGYSITMTCPNGLVVESIHREKSMAVSHIRQKYLNNPFTEPGIDAEEHRSITKNGQVIIFKKSGNIEILFPDSSYILCTKYEKVIVEPTVIEPEVSFEINVTARTKSETGKFNKESKEKSGKSSAIPTEYDHIKNPVYEIFFLEYFVIEANGRKKMFIDDHFEDREVLLIRTATDYCLGEVFSRRMDGTNLLYNSDGMLTVTFPNKTRIVSNFYIEENEVFPEWSEEDYATYNFLKSIESIEELNRPSIRSSKGESIPDGSLKEEEFIQIYNVIENEGYISVQIILNIEHVNFATVTIDTANYEFTIDMPNSVSVTIDDISHYIMKLDDLTKINFDSVNFHVDYESCDKCESRTSCDIDLSDNIDDDHDSDLSDWLRLKDCYGKTVSINYDGLLKIHDEGTSEKELPDDSPVEEHWKSNDSGASQKSCDTCICRELHLSDKVRFFVLHRDLTVSELVHKLLVEQYRNSCLTQPWCSASEYDVFGDNRKLISLLTPIERNESEKWLMDSKYVGKPQRLLFKDLRGDNGKGFYKWMRPYDRFQPVPRLPEPAVQSELPRALVLRTLEQQWSDKDPEGLQGARELFAAIIKYRHIMEEDKETMTADPIRDPRSQEDIDQYQRAQELGKRTIEKVLKRMDEHKLAACGDSKPLPINQTVPGEQSAGESRASLLSSVKEEEERVGELETVVPMRPALARYWRIRAEEKKNEEYFKEVLRSGAVPPYFENVYGGAMWWEVNHAAEEASAAAEGLGWCGRCVTAASAASAPAPAPGEGGVGGGARGEDTDVGEEFGQGDVEPDGVGEY